MSEKSSDRLSYRVKDIPAVTGLPRTRVFALLKSGALKSVKVGGRRILLRSDVESFLVSLKNEAA
jgi:excisionase family DNA binding protein